MRIVIFGLTVSSAWANNHATLWRSLIGALDAGGHEVVFYEQDTPHHAAHRDLHELPGSSHLRIYDAWDQIRREARREADECDAVIVTSYCPDGRAASALAAESRAPVRVFYDLDTSVTLGPLEAGEDLIYLPTDGLRGFDLVLSLTGGRALELLGSRLGARRVAPLHGSVDPTLHHPVPAEPIWSAVCSYLGTWSSDRAAVLERMLVAPARARPGDWFVIGGGQYPPQIEWPGNIARFEHVSPGSHPAFFCSSRLTVNATRAALAALGHCPSARMFEAAACGVPVISDRWDGIETFFTPGDEILLATTTDDVLAALDRPAGELAQIGRRARERVLCDHTGTARAAELVALLSRGPA